MTIDDIKQQIETLMEVYDQGIANYAQARAKYINYDDLRKHMEAKIASRPEYDSMSEAARKRIALSSGEFLTFLEEKRKVDHEYFEAHETIEKAKKFLDALRSLLSFEKDIISKTI